MNRQRLHQHPLLVPQLLQLVLEVDVLRLERFRFVDQVGGAFAFLQATLGRCDFVSFATASSSLLVFRGKLEKERRIFIMSVCESIFN